MKLIVLTFCVLFATVQNVRGNEESMRSLKECIDESGLKGDIEKMAHDDPRLRCIMSCMLEKEGLMKNGEVRIDLLKKDILEDAAELGEKKVSEIAEYCVDLGKELTDVCDKTNLIGMCLKDELEKHNIKFRK